MSKRKTTKGWFKRLFDMDDYSVSATTVFLIITSITATILLLVPAAVLLIEVITTHTIATNLSGMAAYIAAVCGLYASGGILKGWTNYSKYRYCGDKKQNKGIDLEKMEEDIISDDMKNKIVDIVLKQLTNKQISQNDSNENEEEIDA